MKFRKDDAGKRSMIMLVMITFTCLLAGCTTKVTELTEAENDMIAEYIAGRLLKYDMNYQGELIYPEVMEEVVLEEAVATNPPAVTAQPVITEEPVNESVAPSYSPTPVVYKMSDIFERDFEVTYLDYKLYYNYPKNSTVYNIAAEEGMQLLVVRFGVKNVTDKKCKAEFTKYNISYVITIQAGEEAKQFHPLMAILENGGMRYLDTNINAGKTEKAVLIFQVPKNIDMEKVGLSITKDNKTTSQVMK